MSKASEWAQQRTDVLAARPAPLHGILNKTNSGEYVGISVADDGKVVLAAAGATIWLTEDAALKIAGWIFDTCGPTDDLVPAEKL